MGDAKGEGARGNGYIEGADLDGITDWRQEEMERESDGKAMDKVGRRMWTVRKGKGENGERGWSRWTETLSAAEKGRRLIKAANDATVQELQMLLAAGADVGATDGKKNTALHWAAWEGHVEAASCLVGAGAEVDAGNWVQNTPLHWAAWGGRPAVVRLLAASSADPNARNVDGDTPLHFAAEHGRTEEATALLDAGADSGARNHKGKTPVDRARQFNLQHWKDRIRRH
ncbi:ankyrin repeat and SOCS box protein 8-like [Schistocerca nitens]|uniref:ankyrin repeat and SOCS box protein 8-like n=1 Tax=Schistocerca nitens TaxID=7011 RepID=UPI002118618D|nr:ankyrin repeat and SOCS box protein 8-like [Schistocerca nitens]